MKLIDAREVPQWVMDIISELQWSDPNPTPNKPEREVRIKIGGRPDEHHGPRNLYLETNFKPEISPAFEALYEHRHWDIPFVQKRDENTWIITSIDRRL